jgi:hypothetical protein
MRVSVMLVSCGDSVEPAAEADQRAGAVVFGDPVGMAQAAGGATILTGIAVSGLPLLLARGPGPPSRRTAPVRRSRVHRSLYERLGVLRGCQGWLMSRWSSPLLTPPRGGSG